MEVVVYISFFHFFPLYEVVTKAVCNGCCGSIYCFLYSCHRCHSSLLLQCLLILVWYLLYCLLLITGARIRNLQERNQSSYIGSLARRVRDLDTLSGTSLLKEIYRSDPERVIQIFESQPSLHSNPAALSEYVKALVRVDRLDESTLLKTLQRGNRILKNNFSVSWLVTLVLCCVVSEMLLLLLFSIQKMNKQHHLKNVCVVVMLYFWIHSVPCSLTS